MTPSSTSNTTAIASTSDHFQKNDFSNPQQGSAVTPPPMEQTPLKTEMQIDNETFNGKSNTMRSPPNKKDSRKLFVGGLPADITEDEFRVFFEQFGEVVDSVVMFDRETHRSRGFGFVTFQSQEVATRLLNMREGENDTGVGAPVAGSNEPRVGRLVMRGKTCEVKSAEPKESSRFTRRDYQNQGRSNGANKRFVQRSYAQGVYPQGFLHPSAYHDPQYMADHQYPIATPPSFYPLYHPGFYNGGSVYHHAPLHYNPGGHSVPMQDGLHQAYGASGVAMEGAHASPYMEGVHDAGAYALYGHTQMMQAYPHHFGPAMNGYPSKPASGEYVAPGATSSVMHPAAPGLPNKED